MCDQYYDCGAYKELEERVDEARDYLAKVLQVIFVNGRVDDSFLEDIDELCHRLNVKLPKDLNFKIEKKSETLKQIQFLLGATV